MWSTQPAICGQRSGQPLTTDWGQRAAATRDRAGLRRGTFSGGRAHERHFRAGREAFLLCLLLDTTIPRASPRRDSSPG